MGMYVRVIINRVFAIKIGLVSLFVFFSCTDTYDKNSIEKDKECLTFYESLVKKYKADTSLKTHLQHEKFIRADTNHKLFKIGLDDSDCQYRGLRDYGETVIVEISSYKRNLDGWGVGAGEDTYERHFLLVGDWDGFDVKKLLWCGNEKIISEMVVGANFKLVVTHCKGV